MKEVGGNIVINENVFEKDENGALNLLGFADAVGGAQLVKTEDGKISWVKPDTTTVEGLSTAIKSLQTVVGDDKSGLVKQVNENKSAIEKLNGGDTTEGSVAYQIAQVVAGADESYDTLKEIADWIKSHGTTATEMNTQIQTNKGGISELKDLVGETAVASQISTAIDAALKNGEDNKYALAADLTTANGDITALKEKVGNSSVADQINAALKNDGLEKYALADHTHEIANITGLQAILDGKASASDVESLQSSVDGLEAKSHEHTNKSVLDDITAENVAAWNSAQANVIEAIKAGGVALAIGADKSVSIPTATAEALGLVKVDGKTIDSTDGVIGVKAVGISKVFVEDDVELVMDGGNA